MKKYRKILLVSLCIAVPPLLAWLFVNATGKWAWEAYKRQHEARGDSLEFKTLIPPAVPDDQNFAMTPLLKPIFPGDDGYSEGLAKKLKLPSPTTQPAPAYGLHTFGNRALGERINLDDWKEKFGGKDVLAALQKFDPELREITQAARRPYSRFPLAYDKELEMAAPHFRVIWNLAKIYTLRTSAELRSGNADAALEDTQTLLRLAGSIENEPLVISQMVQWTISLDALQVVWEGLEEHRWTDAQLTVLQNALAGANYLKSLSLAFRGDRAGQDDLATKQPESVKMVLDLDLEEMNLNPLHSNKALEHIPKGLIFYQNLLALNLNYDKVLDAIDPAARRIYPARFQAINDALSRDDSRSLFGVWLPNPCEAMAKVEIPLLASVALKAAYAQVSADEAVVACALERYRLAQGRFPDALAALVPAYIKALPHDVITGGPLHYHTTGAAAAGYVLYSVGWNGTDEGGTVATLSDGNVDFRNGDWIWSIEQ